MGPGRLSCKTVFNLSDILPKVAELAPSRRHLEVPTYGWTMGERAPLCASVPHTMGRRAPLCASVPHTQGGREALCAEVSLLSFREAGDLFDPKDASLSPKRCNTPYTPCTHPIYTR